MVLKARPADRQEVINLAIDTVAKAARDGGKIAATVIARNLLDRHPDCRMSLANVQDNIARIAVDHGGVVVLFGLGNLTMTQQTWSDGHGRRQQTIGR